MMLLQGAKQHGNPFSSLRGVTQSRRSNLSLILITLLILCFNPCQAAVEFDGIDDYIESKNISNSLGQKFSVSIWIKVNSIGSFSSILEPQWLSNGGPNYRPFTVYLCDTGKIASVFQDTSNLIDAHTSTTILNTTNWYHIVLVFDSTEILSANRNKLFINSNLEAKSTSLGCVTVLHENISQNSNLMNSSQPLITGAVKNLAGAESEFFNGRIDDIRIYNRALTATEVQALYNTRSKRPSGSLANGLLAHYEMDDDAIGEIVAQAKDSSGNLNHGQFIGFDNLVSNGFSNVVPVQIGTGHSLELDGLNNYIQIAGPSSGPLNNIGTGDFTISTWATNDGAAGYKQIISNWGTTGLHFLTTSSVSPTMAAYVGDGVELTSSFTIPDDNSWHHYVLRRNSGAITIWKDGASEFVGTKAGSIGSAVNTHIGSRGDSIAQLWDGKMDDLRIYDRSLSNGEITFLYNGSGLDPGTSNMQALWTFDNDSALKDSSGNNNHGVGVGGDSLKYTEGVLRR